MKNERGNGRQFVSNVIISLMLVAVLALVSARSVSAQTNQGAIAGNVFDASGGVVANVKIVATNTKTHQA